MSALLAPQFLWLLGIIPVIVVMYLLKLKRHPLVIPSTLLWRKSMQDMVANAPFQKLRNNLLLWLQLLILLLIIAALARPVFLLTGATGQTVIVLIDRSASMQTVESDGGTRLDKARALALEAVDDLGSRDQMMIVAFAEKSQPIQTMTNDKAALRTALRELTPMDTETDLEMAGLLLQEKTMRRTDDGAILPNEGVRVLLISDGGLGPTASSLADIPSVDFIGVGGEVENIGFVAVDVRESFTGTFEYQVFASLLNGGTEAREVYVEMEMGGDVVDIKKALVPAGGEAAVVFTLPESVRGLATMRLASHFDALAADDEVVVMVAPPTEIRVLIVSTGNPFIERAFAVDPRAKVSVIRPTEYGRRDDFDITVFENTSVPGELPAGNFLFINALPPPMYGYAHSSTEPIKNPRVIDWNRVHPTMRYVNFESVLVSEAKPLKTPGDALALVQAAETDLISLHETEARRIVVVNFDILKSYWPVDVSYPIFMSNFIDYCNRAGAGMEKAAYATGVQIPIVPPRDARTARVRTPEGESVDYNLEGSPVAWFSGTQKRGLYNVSFDSGEARQIPVNLLSRLETRIAPVNELQFGGRTITASEESVRTKQEIWHWLALAGLGILLLEWGIYCRRTYM